MVPAEQNRQVAAGVIIVRASHNKAWQGKIIIARAFHNTAWQGKIHEQTLDTNTWFTQG